MHLNIVVSDEDRRKLRELAPRATIRVLPNGVDVERYSPGLEREEGLVFVGGTTWFPNRDALAFFHDDILPLIHQRGVRPQVLWIGSASPQDQTRFGRAEGLSLTGYVRDERPLMQGAACFIVPLRVGGGTRLKILNAWAMGKPVVSTSVGCEGLDARQGENILIADTSEEFAEAVIRVLHDPDLRRRLGSAGREVAKSRWSWKLIGRDMLEAYDGVLKGIPG
jgi:glycosyltransferase involved in cell wall biosynthesis